MFDFASSRWSGKVRCFLYLYSWIALFGTLATTGTAAAEKPPRRVVAYVPNWGNLEAFVPTIEFSRLTHINVAFENPTNAAGDLSFHHRNSVLLEAARARNVPVLVSIGGGAAAENKELTARYFDLISETKRAAFVAKLADYVTRQGFAGLDVDLEGPSINEDYGAFIRDLASALKPQGKLLTAALSQGYGGAKVPESVFEHFDFVNIMAYDGTGPWAPDRPGQHSSLQFARDNVAYWLGRGLPREKAVLGVPFYGHGFGDAARRRRGYPYATILAEYPGAEGKDEVGQTIWYNGIPTIRAKTRLVIDEGLGGVMIWSLDSDVSDERSLLKAIHEVLSASQSEPK